MTPCCSRRDGPVATLTLNRPDALNTLDFTMMDALVARTAEVAADDALARRRDARRGQAFHGRRRHPHVRA